MSSRSLLFLLLALSLCLVPGFVHAQATPTPEPTTTTTTTTTTTVPTTTIPPTTPPPDTGTPDIFETLKVLANFATDPLTYLAKSFKQMTQKELGLQETEAGTPAEGSILYEITGALSPDLTAFDDDGKLKEMYEKSSYYAYFFLIIFVLLWALAYMASSENRSIQPTGNLKDQGLDLAIAFLLVSIGFFLYRAYVEIFIGLNQVIMGSLDPVGVFTGMISGVTGFFTFFILVIPALILMSVFFMIHTIILYYNVAVLPLLIVGYFAPIGIIKGLSKLFLYIILGNVTIPFFYAGFIKVYTYMSEAGILPTQGLGFALVVTSIFAISVLSIMLILAFFATSAGRIATGGAVSAATGNPAPLIAATGNVGLSRIHRTSRSGSRFARRQKGEKEE